MKSFKQYLLESISVSQLDKADSIITSYLSKKISGDVVSVPENLQGGGFGLRYYFTSKKNSFRINWSSPSKIGSIGVESLDFWYNKSDAYHIKLDKEESLVKIIPMIPELLNQKPEIGSSSFVVNDQEVTTEELEESFNDLSELYKNVVEFITGETFSESVFYNKFKKAGEKIRDEILRRKSSLWEISGKKYTWVGSDKDKKEIESLESSILSSIPFTKVKISREVKAVEINPEDKKLDSEIAKKFKATFEQQISDIEDGIEEVFDGPKKIALIMGGGGLGKSTTINGIFKKLGYVDGKDYFLISGKTSAAQTYKSMFKYHDKILYFDDCDNLFETTDGINLIKVATNDAPVRKVSWNTKSSDIVDPDTMSREEMIDQDKAPSYFDFTGRFIFATNLSPDKIAAPILSRAFKIYLNPTREEIIDRMKKIAPKMELIRKISTEDRLKVVDILEKNYPGKGDFRLLRSALEMYAKLSKKDIPPEEIIRKIISYA